MKQLTDFSSLTGRLTQSGTKKKIALACPHDEHTLQVIAKALEAGFAHFILTTCRQIDGELAALANHYNDSVEIIECSSPEEAAREAVKVAKSGEADILMKGSLNTDVLLHAALDKQAGILQKGRVMTHIAVAQIPSYGKLLMFSDAAVIPHPTLEQFDAIVGYCAEACRSIGIDKPHIALTHFSEKTNAKFEHTIHYQEIMRRADDGAYGNAVVGGPMDVKTACDSESGAIKGISSPVVGNADVLVFPNIESGNTFYKTITLFANATMAGWLAGTEVPVVVSSRADSVDSKFYSLVLASLLSSNSSLIS